MKTWTMWNPIKNHTIKRMQNTRPRIVGYVCVDVSKVEPARNANGDRLFQGPNGSYYARENEERSHYQP